MDLIKIVGILALVVIGIIILPLAIGVLAAIFPLACGAFCVIFPILALGAVVGYCLKKKGEEE